MNGTSCLPSNLGLGEFSNNMKDDTLFQNEYKVRIIGQILIFSIGVPLNSGVIYRSFAGNTAPTRINCLIGNLCAINLVYALFSIPFDIGWHITVEWYAGTFCCKVLMFIRMFLFLCGPYMLICISVDRLLAIAFPLRMMVLSNVTPIMCITVYSIAAFLALPQGYFYEAVNMRDFVLAGKKNSIGNVSSSTTNNTQGQTEPMNSPTCSESKNETRLVINNSTPDFADQVPDFTQCVTFGKLSEAGSDVYNFYLLTVQFFVPVFCMLICYALIIVKLTLKHRKQTKAQQEAKIEMITRGRVTANSNRIHLRGTNDGYLERARNRMVSMTACIVVTYILCSTPYHVSILVEHLYKKEGEGENGGFVKDTLSVRILNEVLNIFQMAGVVADPVIYGIFQAKPEENSGRPFFSKHSSTGQKHGDPRGSGAALSAKRDVEAGSRKQLSFPATAHSVLVSNTESCRPI